MHAVFESMAAILTGEPVYVPTHTPRPVTRSDGQLKSHRKATQAAIKASSVPVMDVETGVIYESQREAGRVLGVSKATAQRWTKTGRFKKLSKVGLRSN